MGNLLFENSDILTDDEAAALWEDGHDEPLKEDTEENKSEEQDNTVEVDSEELFGEEPESVDSEKDKKEKEDSSSEEDDSSSPENSYYSSMAGALKEEGVLPDLSDEEIDAVKGPDDFLALMKKQIQTGLDEQQKRVLEALDNGVQPSVIKQYEDTIAYLNSLDEATLSAETEEGDETRRNLIMKSYLNRGISPERAKKMTDRVFSAADDIEEAKIALEEHKKYYQSQYKEVLDNAREEEAKEKEATRQQAEKLKEDIMKEETVFGDIPIDKATRQKVFDNLTRPVYKDASTGTYLTEMQKYRKEHENDYLRYSALFFTLTDGYKNFDKLVKPTANRETRKKLKEVEEMLKGSAAGKGGRMKYVSSGNPKAEKPWYEGGDWKLDKTSF